MLVLDENLPEGQRLWLRRWRFRFRVIGANVAFSGTKDENLIPVLHRLIVAHTDRGENIRIISARKATRRERNQYEEGTKE